MKENLQKQAYNFITGVSNTDKETFMPKYQPKFDPFHQLTIETKATVAKRRGEIFASGQPWPPQR